MNQGGQKVFKLVAQLQMASSTSRSGFLKAGKETEELIPILIDYQRKLKGRSVRRERKK
jgi:hypothetical protein